MFFSVLHDCPVALIQALQQHFYLILLTFAAMATVIGIKAYSPAQDGKKTLKVKSFVPEQYSDLVAQSAKY